MPYLEDIISAIADDVRALLKAPAVPLGKATPPSASGVYLLSVGDDVTYVGEAKGSKGLRDRLLSKHISGDDSHAIQRAYLEDFPDRLLRRDHIWENVLVRWLEIADRERVSAVERVLICLYSPKWNKK
ncbi:MAG: hypothetical protein WAV18_31640 [Roseiarcus sp.]